MKPPPNRLRLIAVAVSSVLLTAGLVRAASDAWRQKLDAASKAAEAQRKTLGLDGPDDEDALSQKYPSPEVQFGNGVTQYEGAFATLCPGETGRLFIPGKFLEGTTFVVKSDDVQVTGEKLTPKGWEASIAVPRDWPHDFVRVRIAAPVSFTGVTVRALEVRCTMRFKLALDSGPTLEATLAWDAKKEGLAGAGVWKPGGKVQLKADGSPENFILERDLSMQEVMARAQREADVINTSAMAAASARMTKAQEAVGKCFEKPQAEQPACIAAASKEMETSTNEVMALRASLLAKLTVGCDRLSLKLGRGTVEGTAENCSDAGTHKVTGTFSSP